MIVVSDGKILLNGKDVSAMVSEAVVVVQRNPETGVLETRSQIQMVADGVSADGPVEEVEAADPVLEFLSSLTVDELQTAGLGGNNPRENTFAKVHRYLVAKAVDRE